MQIYDTIPKTLKQLKQWNQEWYEKIKPERYAECFGNPKFCVQEFGKDYGQIFSFIYAQIRCGFFYAVEERLFDLVIQNELFWRFIKYFVMEKIVRRRFARLYLNI